MESIEKLMMAYIFYIVFKIQCASHLSNISVLIGHVLETQGPQLVTILDSSVPDCSQSDNNTDFYQMLTMCQTLLGHFPCIIYVNPTKPSALAMLLSAFYPHAKATFNVLQM